MKTRLSLLLSLLLLTALSSFGQELPYAWRWAQAQPFKVKSVATDAAGNAYVTGEFSGTVAVGTTTLTSRSNGTDILVAKFTAQGKNVWATAVGPDVSPMTYQYASTSSANDISVNPLTGEAYVAASFVGTISQHMRGTPLTSYGVERQQDMSEPSALILKYTTRGQVEWARRAGGGGPATLNAIATDLLGNSYLTGSAYGQFRLDDGATLPLGSRQLIFFSLTAKGGTRWLKTGQSPLGASGADIAVDAGQGCYLIGRFAGQLNLGTYQFTDDNVFIARLEQRTGNVVWAKQSGSFPTGSVNVNSIAVDALGNSFVGGSVSGSFNFDFSFINSSRGWEGFVARFDADGTTRWLQPLGQADPYEGVQVVNLSPLPLLQQALVSYTQPHRVGSTLRLQALEPDGRFAWMTTVQNTGYASSQALAVGPGPGIKKVQVYVAGEFQGVATFGETTLNANDQTSFLSALSYKFSFKNIDWSFLRIYPNPVRDQLTLQLPALPKAKVALYNSFGRLVRELNVAQSAVESSLTINVQSLPSGLYTLRITTDDTSETRQVQIQ